VSGCRAGKIRLWNPAKSRKLIRTSELPGEITRLEWASDGRSFAASSSEGAVRVFRPAAE